MSKPLQIIHITDCHLGTQPGDSIHGVDADASLAQVIRLAHQQQPDADALLATGDIANHGDLSAYQRFQHRTQGLAKHTRWLAGNHDSAASMRHATAHSHAMEPTLIIGRWLIVMLDSKVSGKIGGKFSSATLTRLEQTLANHHSCHTLIALHHHPIATHCSWLNDIGLTNSDAFFSTIAPHQNVRGILWGHVHQKMDQERHGIKLMATPSSCIQYAPNSDHFQLDTLNPGYRWLQLYPSGAIETGIWRVDN